MSVPVPRIVVIGPRYGKTTLINRLTFDRSVDSEPPRTTGPVVLRTRLLGYLEVEVVDTPGWGGPHSPPLGETARTLLNCDLVVVVFHACAANLEGAVNVLSYLYGLVPESLHDMLRKTRWIFTHCKTDIARGAPLQELLRRNLVSRFSQNVLLDLKPELLACDTFADGSSPLFYKTLARFLSRSLHQIHRLPLSR